MYNVKIIIYSENKDTLIINDSNENNYQLKLLSKGATDQKYYSIIDFNNKNIKNQLSINKNRKYNLKRKRNFSGHSDNNNKKVKFSELEEENEVLCGISETNDKVNILSNDVNELSEVKKIKEVQKLSKKTNKKINLKTNCDFGDMNWKCEFCGAVYWKEERQKSNCCQKGKVTLSPLSDYNKKLKTLLLHDKTYRQLIRYYNNIFSFATFRANVSNEKQKAVYNLKIQGQICHLTPTCLIPNKNEEPVNCQLYIYDDEIATE